MRIEKVHWNVRTRCNLPCSFCYLWRRPDEAELSTPTARALITEAADVAEWFVFGGGDPLMRGDILNLVGVARDHRLFVELQTNAHLLADHDAEALLSRIHRLGLSLDGVTARDHDSFRSAPGNFERNLEALAMADSMGTDVTIRTIVARDNADRIAALGELLAGHPSVRKWSLRQFAPLGRGARTKERHEISEATFSRTVALIGARYAGAHFNVNVLTLRDFERCYCLIAPDGTIYSHPETGEDYKAIGRYPDESMASLVSRVPYDRTRRGISTPPASHAPTTHR